MGKLSKSLGLLLVLIMIVSGLSLLMVKPVCAQTVSKPSVPQFTVELVGPSFDIPPSYSFNSSTGLFDANDGYHIQYSTVKIVIKNQPFSNQSGGDSFYYNIRIKPHNYPDSYWQELFSAGNEGFPIQALSNYTTIPLPIEGAQVLGVTISTGATTDIQVEAMIGHIGRNNTMTPYPYPYVLFGETSGWSNTQTVTVPPKTPFSASSIASPSPTPTPNANSIALPSSIFVTLIIVLLLTILILSMLLLRRGQKTRFFSSSGEKLFLQSFFTVNLLMLI